MHLNFISFLKHEKLEYLNIWRISSNNRDDQNKTNSSVCNSDTIAHKHKYKKLQTSYDSDRHTPNLQTSYWKLYYADPSFFVLFKNFLPPARYYHLVLTSTLHIRNQKLQFLRLERCIHPLRLLFTTFRQLVGTKLIPGNYRLSTLTADTRDADLPIFTLQPDTRLRTARFPRILLFVNAYLPRKHAQAHLSFFFPVLSFFFSWKQLHPAGSKADCSSR